MKKVNIVKKNEDFAKAINKRKIYKNNIFVIYILKKDQEKYRFGISVGKKTGNAVVRNLCKRQLRMIVDKYKKHYQNDLDYIIMIRNGYINSSFSDKEEKFFELIRRINKDIIKENKNEEKP